MKRLTLNDADFKYLRLHTSYQYKLGKIGETKEELTPFTQESKITYGHFPCFGSMISYIRSRGMNADQKVNMELSIRINSSISTMNRMKTNNLLVVDEETMIKHLELLKRYVPYDYNIAKHRGSISVNCSLHGCNLLQIKYLCFWIRYLYEFPSNVLLRDIYQLYKEDDWEFSWLSPDNLMQPFNILSSMGGISVRADQCIAINRSFMNDSEIISQLKKGLNFDNDTSVNSMYRFLRNKGTKRPYTYLGSVYELFSATKEIASNFSTICSGEWMSKLEDRKQIYDSTVRRYLELSNITRAMENREPMKAENSYR